GGRTIPRREPPAMATLSRWGDGPSAIGSMRPARTGAGCSGRLEPRPIRWPGGEGGGDGGEEMTDVEATFAALQAGLVPLWQSIGRMNADEQTIVVVPSITLDSPDTDGATMQALEERFLFLLFLLRQPRARMIYVTSRPIAPEIIDY